MPITAYTPISDAQIDSNSPITVALETAFRDNDLNNREWIGKDYTPEENHDHDGINSKLVNILKTFGPFPMNGLSTYTITGIPEEAKGIQLVWNRISMTGSSGGRLVTRAGTLAGGIESAGYTPQFPAGDTTRYEIGSSQQNANNEWFGFSTWRLSDPALNIWSMWAGYVYRYNSTAVQTQNLAQKQLAGKLSQIQIYTISGSFDQGWFTMQVET